MSWAVLIGQQKLARLLWEKTNHPLRAALIAARTSQRLASKRLADTETERRRAIEDAEEYSRWVTGLLDEMSNKEALEPLTRVYAIDMKKVGDPNGNDKGRDRFLTRRLGGRLQDNQKMQSFTCNLLFKQRISMWPRSVLDEIVARNDIGSNQETIAPDKIVLHR